MPDTWPQLLATTGVWVRIADLDTSVASEPLVSALAAKAVIRQFLSDDRDEPIADALVIAGTGELRGHL